jgi:hypothetical protein
VKIKQLLSLILLAVFCMRFLPSLEVHDHRSEAELCIQEHTDHRHQYSSCELTEVLGWNFQGHCEDKNHLKESGEHCLSCGYDFVKFFPVQCAVAAVYTRIQRHELIPVPTTTYAGFTLLLCNKGPPAIA